MRKHDTRPEFMNHDFGSYASPDTTCVVLRRFVVPEAVKLWCCIPICWVVYIKRNMVYGNGLNVCLKMWYIMCFSDILCPSRFQYITSGIWCFIDICDGKMISAKWRPNTGVKLTLVTCEYSPVWLVVWQRQILGTLVHLAVRCGNMIYDFAARVKGIRTRWLQWVDLHFEWQLIICVILFC